MLSPTLEVAKREFLEHVLSWRFLIALVLSTLILVTSVVALAAAYKEDLEAFNDNQENLARNQNSHSTMLIEVNRWLQRPNVLSIFVGGAGDEYRADNAPAVSGGSSQPQSGSNSPTNVRFTPLDLGFVAVVVMTFMAVIFSYDAVSGERERGTLKLVLSNPVPKDAVLLGKYLGGMGSILIPFLISVVVGLAALSLTGITLAAGAWLRLAVILAVFLLMLSAFYLVGLLVSSLSRRSSTSLLALTLVWLVLVFGAGNVAAVAAKVTVETTGGAELAERYRALDQETFNEQEAIGREMWPLQNKQAVGNLTPDEQARLRELREQQDAVRERAAAERQALRASALRQLDTQLRTAELFAAVSPAEAFRSLSTAFARSDYWSYREMAEAAFDYQLEVQRAREEFMAAQNLESGGLGFTRVFSGGIMPGTAIAFGSEDAFVAPNFNYRPASVSEQVSSPDGIRNILVLIAYNLVAFVGAYVAFLRYDVR